MASKTRTCLLVMFVLGLVACVAGVVLYFVKPSIVSKLINQNFIVDDPSATAYQLWADHGGQVPIYMAYSMFNLTNPDEFVAGKKPILQVVGPFTYRELLWREAVAFSPDGNTVEYTYHNPFEFVPELSGPGLSEDTIITTVNPAVAGALAIAGTLPLAAREGVLVALNAAMINQGAECTVAKRMGDLMWGYYDGVLGELAADARLVNLSVNPFVQVQQRDNKMLYAKTSRQRTGKDDPDSIQRMTKWAGFETLPYWGDQWANTINGTDGWQFHAGIDKDELLYAFVDSLFRSVELTCWQPCDPVDIKGVSVLDFGLNPHMIKNCSMDQSTCSFNAFGPVGVFNLSGPTQAPAFLSKPFFLNADQWYRDLLGEGFPVPDQFMHDTHIYVEPLTGTAFAARRQLQVNLHVKVPSGLPLHFKFRALPEAYFPMVLINETTWPPDNLATMLKSQLFGPLKMFTIAIWVAIGVGGGCALVSLAAWVVAWRTRASRSEEYAPLTSIS